MSGVRSELTQARRTMYSSFDIHEVRGIARDGEIAVAESDEDFQWILNTK